MKKLVYRNEWEYDVYSIDGKEIKDLKTVSIRGKRYKVAAIRVSVPYYDMGHSYSQTSTHYFVEESVFGRKRRFDLNTIVGKQPVFALSYTLEEEKNESR